MFDAIDFILNVAGLLLWLNWRSARLDPFTRGVPATLGGTVRRAEPMRLKRWHFLAALVALLMIRAFFYEHIGPAANWTPKLNLLVVTPAFPLAIHSHPFLSALAFSAASFLRVLIVFYFWLLAIAIINRHETSPDPLQKLLLVQIGRVARWPLALQLLLPFIIVIGFWALFHPLFVSLGVTTHIRSNALLIAQGAVLAPIVFLSLRILLLAFLIVHLIVNYVYLGTNPVWEFISTTSRNMISPLSRLQLRVGRIDLAPVIGIVLIILLLYLLPGYLLHQLDRRGLTIWPQ